MLWLLIKTYRVHKTYVFMQTKSPTKPSAFYIDNYLAGFVHDPVARCFAPPSPASAFKEMGISMKGEAQVSAEGQETHEEEEADKIGDNGAVMVDIPRFVCNACDLMV